MNQNHIDKGLKTNVLWMLEINVESFKWNIDFDQVSQLPQENGTWSRENLLNPYMEVKNPYCGKYWPMVSRHKQLWVALISFISWR